MSENQSYCWQRLTYAADGTASLCFAVGCIVHEVANYLPDDLALIFIPLTGEHVLVDRDKLEPYGPEKAK